MLKYIIKDLEEAVAYLRYWIIAGAFVGLLLN